MRLHTPTTRPGDDVEHHGRWRREEPRVFRRDSGPAGQRDDAKRTRGHRYQAQRNEAQG